MERVLVLGGDREPAGRPVPEALDLLETRQLPEHGIDKIALACFPGGPSLHPGRRTARKRSTPSWRPLRGAVSMSCLSASSCSAPAAPRLREAPPEGGIMPPPPRRACRTSRRPDAAALRKRPWRGRLEAGDADAGRRAGRPERRRKPAAAGGRDLRSSSIGALSADRGVPLLCVRRHGRDDPLGQAPALRTHRNPMERVPRKPT